MKRTGMFVRGALVLLHASIGCGPFEYEDGQADSTTGSGGQATTGSGGAPGYALQGDDALVVRYFIDDDPGTPQQIHDSGPMGIDMSISSDNTSSNPPVLVEDMPGHRGLHWPARDTDWRAHADISGGVLPTEVQASSALTVEAVASVLGDTDMNKILFIGRDYEDNEDASKNDDNFDDLSLRASTNNRLDALVNNIPIGEWYYNDPDSRVVIHLVIDFTKAEPLARRRLFINGSDMGRGQWAPDATIRALDLTMSTDLVLGNGRFQSSSIRGTIYYAAVYGRALDPEEIQTNAAMLLLNDDEPTPGNPAH